MAHVRSLVDAALAAAGEAWISDRSLRRVRQLAEVHPGVNGGMALEVHLGPQTDRVDLVTRVTRRDGPAICGVDGPELATARRFVTCWLSEPWGERVPYVDLEFDLDAESRGCFVGAMIEPHLHDGAAAVLHDMREEGEEGRADDGPSAVALAVLAAAEIGIVDERALGLVRRCFAALPEGGFIAHLGSLRSRLGGCGDLVRLIASVPRRFARDFLRGLEWPGSTEALAAALERHLGGGPRVELDLNVTPGGLLPETGFYSTVWSLPRYRALVRRAAEHLLGDGLVTAEQAAGVCRFAEAETPAIPIPRLLTTKLKLDGHGRLSAKVYLSFLRGG